MDDELKPGTLVFACSATIEVADVTCERPGKRVCVFTTPDQGHQRPGLAGEEGMPMLCMFMCPCTVRESGRKTERVWFADGTKGYTVTCKVKTLVTTEGRLPDFNERRLQERVSHE